MISRRVLENLNNLSADATFITIQFIGLPNVSSMVWYDGIPSSIGVNTFWSEAKRRAIDNNVGMVKAVCCL